MVRIHVVKGFRVQRRRRVSTEGGHGFTTVNDGFDIADLEVYIDADALAKTIGHKAMRSKRGRTVLQGGAVMVRAIRRRTELQT